MVIDKNQISYKTVTPAIPKFKGNLYVEMSCTTRI